MRTRMTTTAMITITPTTTKASRMSIDSQRWVGLLASLAIALLAGCARNPDSGSAASAPEPMVVTHYSEGAELFVEFPPLVSGETSTFAAHFTRLADFKPMTEGTVDVLLSGGQSPPERFRVRAPARAGLFTPAVVPRAVGERQLSLLLETSGLSSRHDLGAITVFADVATAAGAPVPVAPMPEGDIGFLKEQQWQTSFANEAVQLRSMRESVRAPATLRAAGNGEFLITAAAPGRVIGTPAGFPVLGQTVAQGDVLATLVPRLGTQTDVGTLAAELTQARAAAALSRADLERMESLFADEAVAERRVAEARAADRIAQTQLQVAQQRQSAYQSGGSGAGIALRAPMAGVLAQVHVAQGAAVAEGDALFHVVDRSTLWLVVDIADTDAGRLQTPTGAEFELPGSDEPMRITVGDNGELVGVGATIDPVSRTVSVIFALSDPPSTLVFNQRVDARVFTGTTRDALSVPATAVIDDGGERVVYVQRGGEAFSRVPVTLGLRDGERFEVVAGLFEGDRVVTEGAMQIRLAAATPEAMGHGHAH
jgi:cobalt-zinc-cadmium efflux system membrane fusion protein